MKEIGDMGIPWGSLLEGLRAAKDNIATESHRLETLLNSIDWRAMIQSLTPMESYRLLHALDPMHRHTLSQVCIYHNLTLPLPQAHAGEIDFVLLPPGCFRMGIPYPPEEAVRRAIAREYGEEFVPLSEVYQQFFTDWIPAYPAYEVEINQPFYFGIYPVAQRQWRQFMGEPPADYWGDDFPVDEVSYEMAMDFCKRISVATKRKIRLPSEREWEYACRAGSKDDFCFGEDTERLPEFTWHMSEVIEAQSKYGGRIYMNRTHPVGRKRPNAWGIYDCHCNIAEWCLDNFEAYPGNLYKHPDFGRGLKVLRGGFYVASPSAKRVPYMPDMRDDWTGFRVVMECETSDIENL